MTTNIAQFSVPLVPNGEGSRNRPLPRPSRERRSAWPRRVRLHPACDHLSMDADDITLDMVRESLYTGVVCDALDATARSSTDSRGTRRRSPR